MPNVTGNDAAASEARSYAELIRFNATVSLDDLAVLELRLKQAVQRDPSLRDLLEPGIDEVRRVMQWQREMVVKGCVTR